MHFAFEYASAIENFQMKRKPRWFCNRLEINIQRDQKNAQIRESVDWLSVFKEKKKRRKKILIL